MSIKEINVGQYENTIQYMFHEEDRESFEILLGEEEVCSKAREGARAFKLENREIEVVRKKRVKTFTEMVVDAALDEFTTGGLLKDGVKKEMVIRFIISFFGNNRKVFDKFIIYRIYNCVAYHLFGQNFVEEFAAEVMMV